MAFKTLEQSDTISIGGEEGQKKAAGGLLTDIRYEVGANKSVVYEFMQKDGNPLKVWGSTTIDDKMNPTHIGKFVKFVFKGMETSGSGRTFKDIAVQVWDDNDPLTEDMLQWPLVEKYYDVGDKSTAETVDEDDDLPF